MKELVKEMIAAPSCCAELKEKAEAWLAAEGDARKAAAEALIAESKGKYHVEDLEKIEVDVRTAAYKIIEAKKATYYGIGIALNRLTKSILGDENSVQTVSAYLRGEYGQTGIFIGVPAIINAQGVQSVLECHLTANEQERFDASCDTLREYFTH